jgi:hypothetical protein
MAALNKIQGLGAKLNKEVPWGENEVLGAEPNGVLR